MFIYSFVYVSTRFTYINFIAILAADFLNVCVSLGICVFGVVLYNLFYCFCAAGSGFYAKVT